MITSTSIRCNTTSHCNNCTANCSTTTCHSTSTNTDGTCGGIYVRSISYTEYVEDDAPHPIQDKNVAPDLPFIEQIYLDKQFKKDMKQSMNLQRRFAKKATKNCMVFSDHNNRKGRFGK